MARACAPALLALALAALALAASPAAAQNSTFGETQLNGTGPVYKKQDSLDPFYANLYGIPVPKGQPDPDIYITLEALGSAGADKLGLYCNPSWGQYSDVNANYPQPGYAVWQSDVANGVDTVFISRNDRLYRPPSARDVNSSLYAAYQPYFICSVINLDGQARISYRLEADLINNQSPLNTAEQQALASIYSQCCPDQPGVCVEWRAQNAEAAAAPAAAAQPGLRVKVKVEPAGGARVPGGSGGRSRALGGTLSGGGSGGGGGAGANAKPSSPRHRQRQGPPAAAAAAAPQADADGASSRAADAAGPKVTLGRGARVAARRASPPKSPAAQHPNPTIAVPARPTRRVSRATTRPDM